MRIFKCINEPEIINLHSCSLWQPYKDKLTKAKRLQIAKFDILAFSFSIVMSKSIGIGN